MDPERWRQIEELYHAARECAASDRPALLAQAGPEVRGKVEALLAQEHSGKILDRPAADLVLDSTVTQIAAGAQLGPYKIEAQIGAGGMGQVYRAIDTRLGRKVAVKVSAKEYSDRFEREARAISALNHPHICTLHDVGPNYLVMELCDGETLAARLKRGPVSLDRVLQFGAQIAGALAEAHSKGITHRDLKPGNVMITRSGVKVLDFGLARSSGDDTITASNVVMGTPAYMAPEQRKGKACDARTDIYALGLILFEMANGNRAPLGEKPATDRLPEKLAHAVDRCLVEDPEERWQSVRDLKAQLEWASKAPAAPPTSAEKQRLRWPLVAGVAGLTLVAAVAVLIWRRPVPSSPFPTRFVVSLADQSLFDGGIGGVEAMPVPSPDGRYLLVRGVSPQGQPALWIRPLDAADPRPLSGTEGVIQTGFWSADSQWIGFFANGRLKKISLNGGTPQTMATLERAQNPIWGPRGDIIYRSENRAPLFRISESGGAPVQITKLDADRKENSHRYQQFLPDGRRFLFVARSSERKFNALYLGSLDTGKVKRLMPIDSNARYVASNGEGPGSLVYYRDGALVSQSLDLDREVVVGEPRPILNGIAYFFTVSADGRTAVIQHTGAVDGRLVWYDRTGEVLGNLGPSGVYGQQRISPDGARVAFATTDPQTGNRDIFLLETARGVSSRLTNNEANDWYPVWAPDGKRILFGSDRTGGVKMFSYLKHSLDIEADEARFPGDEPIDWSHDGKWILFGVGDLWITAAKPDAEPFRYLATRFQEASARFSPDGKWIAYVSNESGRLDVYVRPFTGTPATAEGKIQISSSGGDYPVWNPAGGELYFMSGDAVVHAIDTRNLGHSEGPPRPVRLFRPCEGTAIRPLPLSGIGYNTPYDTNDGKRFLVNCATEPPGRFTILLNWSFQSKP